MLRITSGIAKGKKIISPLLDGFRSVQGKTKIAIFSILGEKVVGSVCLDLFSGSGNLGIEAISRGAQFCDFVDNDPEATRTITKNLINCNFVDKSNVHTQNALKFVGNAGGKYDIIFADPFFDNTSNTHLVKKLQNILAKDGVVVFSHGIDFDVDKAVAGTVLNLYAQRNFGIAYISILRKTGLQGHP
ncbi:RsmD family RNA methyltransferase [candidate division WWE3 bacterium]|nr:RsmD family RNA methyltransferase [candidate division WWE3 bacterium]